MLSYSKNTLKTPEKILKTNQKKAVYLLRRTTPEKRKLNVLRYDVSMYRSKSLQQGTISAEC